MSNLATIVNNILADSGIDDINVIVSTGSYNNPSWITALSWTKITGAPSFITGTGANGQVAYFNGASTITSESNLFWDAANDRLGIGKNNPGANLDVVGSGIFTSNVLARAFYAVGDNMTSGGFFALPQFNSANFAGVTYTSLYALGTTTFGINYNQGATFRNAVFSATAISDNATRTYTLPNADGTLALTSAVSGSTGQVAYFNGTSTITGESNLFWDAANDRLGIGKNNPAVALDVVGAGAFSSTLRATEITASMPSGNGALYINNSSLTGKNWTFIPETSSGESNLLLFYTGASAGTRMTLTNSGNLGLGVTPSAWSGGGLALQVSKASLWSFNGNNTYLGNNYFLNSSTQRVYIGNGFATEYAQINGEHIWYNASNNTSGAGAAVTLSQAMTLDASGLLNIGGTGGTKRLNVFGDGRLLATNPQLDFTLSANTNFTHSIVGAEFSSTVALNRLDFKVANGSGTQATVMSMTGGGNVGIGITSINEKLMVNGAIVSNSFLNNNQTSSSVLDFYLGTARIFSYGATGVGGNIGFYTAEGGQSATERMRITSGGNVGIGTTSPQSQLHIYNNSAGATFRLQGTRTADGEVGVINFSNITDIAGGYIIGSIAVNRSGFDNGGAMIFNTATAASTPTERMRITAAGNIGIGTASPNLLTWNRAVTINTATGNSALELSIGDAAQAYFAADASDIFLASFANKNLKLRTNNADRITITSGGNVLVGTQTDNGQRMQIAGGASTALRLDANSGVAALNIGAGATLSVDAAGVGGGRFLITSGGNVGIGTDTPDTFSYGGNRNFLTLRSNATNQEPFLQLVANGTGNSLIDFCNSTVRRATIIGFDGSHLGFYTNGSNSGTSVTERMRITSGGNVGIGETSPAATLDVNGTVKAQGFFTSKGNLNVNDSTWTTIYTIPSTTAAEGVYYVFANRRDAANGQAFTQVLADRTYLREINNSDDAVQLRIDGRNIQVYQVYGTTVEVIWSVMWQKLT